MLIPPGAPHPFPLHAARAAGVSQRSACDIGVNDLRATLGRHAAPPGRPRRRPRRGRRRVSGARAGDLGAVARASLRSRSCPAAPTVLFDGVADRDGLAAPARRPGRPTGARPSGELVEVPVTYDGADLAFVADAWGTDEAGVVARHGAIEFVAAFCGFAPGFSYLSGLPEEPRRTPPGVAATVACPPARSAWPGPWCGVYPTASPGGWRLLGRTDAPLWDQTREQPALLAPGTRVRFVRAMTPARHRRGRADHRPGPWPLRARPPGRPARRGARRAGCGAGQPDRRQRSRRSGARDAARRAGAARRGRLLGRGHRRGPRAPHARSGSRRERRCGSRRRRPGCAAMSRSPAGSTCLPCSGRARPTPSPGSDRPGWRPARCCRSGAGRTEPRPIDAPRPPVRGALRITPGPRADWFDDDALERLCATAYVVAADSNRIGLRLDGPALPRRRGATSGRSWPARGWCSAPCRCRRADAGGVPGRPPADRRLPGDRGRRRGRPVAVRPAATGRRGAVQSSSSGSGGRHAVSAGSSSA